MGHFPFLILSCLPVRAWRNGRRARFRFWCPRACEFKSRRPHDSSEAREYAVVAQLVECHLAKVDVAGPNPVYRSTFPVPWPSGKAKVCKTFTPQFKSGWHLCSKPYAEAWGFILPFFRKRRSDRKSLTGVFIFVSYG